LRHIDAFTSSSGPAEGSPGYFGSGYTDANGAFWQEINLQALSQQPQFLSISA
jgi:twitching motility protein PilI